MSKTITTETREEQRLYVCKNNDLIRYTQYNLTTQQQKILLYCVSKIRPDDPPDTVYTISIADMCKVCGIAPDEKGGWYYETMKADLRKLAQGEWCKMDNGDEWLLSWIRKPKIRKGSGTITLKFDEDMAPYLFELKECYTQYRLEKVLAFECKYTIRLYEILRSYMPQTEIDEGGKREICIRLEDLRRMLGLGKAYARWAELRRNVIDKAMNEINAINDEMRVSYEPMKTGRTIDGLKVTMESAHAKQRLHARQRTRERLGAPKNAIGR